jgi:hypothetical protein
VARAHPLSEARTRELGAVLQRPQLISAKWLKIIFVMWERQVPYDEQYHLATMTRQQLRRQKQIA